MSTPLASPGEQSLRDRVVRAAVALTVDLGWAQVTMGQVADRVGVSRQTVHHEVGTKAGLAEAVIQAELDGFLGVVNAAFDRHPDDLGTAIEDASRSVLELAQDNHLLHAVVSATHGADTELLPLLTTHADSLLASAKAVLVARVTPYDEARGITAPRLDSVVDVVVRVVLSHVMAPSGTPAETAASLAWIADRVLTA